MKIRKKEKVEPPVVLNEKDKQVIRDMMLNASMSRSSLLSNLIDPRRDIDDECGYPKELTTDQYQLMYDREGLATRVVSLFPEESWADEPQIVEDVKGDDTEFEKSWKDLEQQRNLNAFMLRIDRLSGIGRFGVLLLGLNDGKKLSDPVEGIDEKGDVTENRPEYELLFLRAFSESVVKVKSTQRDKMNPRYGKPVMYEITFGDAAQPQASTGDSKIDTGKGELVHWTRLIHVADNRESSEVFGVPRMQSLFNRLYDLRKICGGSAEMFWKGGFPGYAFEMDPQAQAPVAGSDEDAALTEQITSYANGLQRYLRLQGISVNSLNPQVAEPKAHVDVQLEIIAIAMGVPKRIFMGSEQAKLAAEEDARNWNKRIARRQNKYLSPYIIRPLVDRLIAYGVLPEPKKYEIIWPDLAQPSELDKATVLKARVEAFSKYVAGGVDLLIPPEIFFKMFMDLDEAEIKEIIKAAEKRQKEFEDEQAELDAAVAEEEANGTTEPQEEMNNE